MKRLPPAIQENHRYLKFQIHGNDEKSIGEVVNAVWNSMLKYMGTHGASKANIWIIGNKFDRESQEGVIKVCRDNENELRAAITINNGFDDESFLTVEKVSGTLTGLEE